MKPVLYTFVGTAILLGAIFLVFFRDDSPQARKAETSPTSSGSEEGETQGHSVFGPRTANPPSDGNDDLERIPREREVTGQRPPSADKPEGQLRLAEGNAEVTFELLDPNSDPVQNVTVTILGGRMAKKTVSDIDGIARFENIAPGTYSFTVKADAVPKLKGATTFTLSSEENRLIALTVGRYDLSISGRVLDSTGKPLGGIMVFATKQLFGNRDEAVVRMDWNNLRVESESDGGYEISGLDAADYLLNTEATEEFPTVRKIYRAGVTSADLILGEGFGLEIYGLVTSEGGAPLEGVKIQSVGQAKGRGVTDSIGEYTVQLLLREGQTAQSLVARKSGFREERIYVRMDEIGEAESWQVDIVMKPLGVQVLVVGQIIDSRGMPIESETVHLRSAANSAKYEGTSGPDGQFFIKNVQVGNDYRLWLYPRHGYKDYSLVPVEIREPGSEFDIVLEPLEMGTVSGTMVDILGEPVPHFSLWLRSLKALGDTVSVVGDDAGAFVVEDIPVGDLQFQTRSLPRLTVRGIRLAPNEVKEAVLVLDWGDLSFQGSVLDEDEVPIAGARVTLTWKHNANGAQSSSFRNTVTDAAGYFTFSGLGAGDHRIIVTTKSHGTTKEQYEVGGGGPEPVIRLAAP